MTTVQVIDDRLGSCTISTSASGPASLLSLPNEILDMIVDWLWLDKRQWPVNTHPFSESETGTGDGYIRRSTLAAVRLTCRCFAYNEHVSSYLCWRMSFVASPLGLEQLRNHDFSRLCNAVREATFVPTDFRWMLTPERYHFRFGLLFTEEEKDRLDAVSETTRKLYEDGEFSRIWARALGQLKGINAFPMLVSSQQISRHKKHLLQAEPTGLNNVHTNWQHLFEASLAAISAASISPRSLGLGFYDGKKSWGWYEDRSKESSLMRVKTNNLTQLDLVVHENSRFDGSSLDQLLYTTAGQLVTLRIRSDPTDDPVHLSIVCPPSLGMPKLKRLILRGVLLNPTAFAKTLRSLTSLEELILEKIDIVLGLYHEWAYVCRALYKHDNVIHVGFSRVVTALLAGPNGWHWGYTTGAAQRNEQNNRFWKKLRQWLELRNGGNWAGEDFKVCCHHM